MVQELGAVAKREGVGTYSCDGERCDGGGFGVLDGEEAVDLNHSLREVTAAKSGSIRTSMCSSGVLDCNGF